MATECKPYVKYAPGDLITAEGMNEMQDLICNDIHTHVDEGIASITKVDTAENAEKLDGKTAQELCKEWLEDALEAIPGRSGYMKVFKRLKSDEVGVIEHNLKSCPLVDIYRLLPFEVVCAIDDDKMKQTVNFYLYHTSEKKIPDPESSAANRLPPIEIESSEFPVQFKIPLEEILAMFEVPYTDDSGLGDLETELWKAIFSAPNDEFDMEDYCHSPWYERCCREERTVESVKKKGDWDDLWLKIMPIKSVNLFGANNDSIAPRDLIVAHFNMNTLGLKWEPGAVVGTGGEATDNRELIEEEQKLMLLLKV